MYGYIGTSRSRAKTVRDRAWSDWGLGFRVERLGFRVQGLWFRQEEISHSSSWPDMPGLEDGFTIVRFSLNFRLWVHLYWHLLIVRISSFFLFSWGLAKIDSKIASPFSPFLAIVHHMQVADQCTNCGLVQDSIDRFWLQGWLIHKSNLYLNCSLILKFHLISYLRGDE